MRELTKDEMRNLYGGQEDIMEICRQLDELLSGDIEELNTEFTTEQFVIMTDMWNKVCVPLMGRG